MQLNKKKTLDRIRPEDLQNVKLKRSKNIDKDHKNNNDEGFTPSLDEIRNALQSLQKINNSKSNLYVY